MAAGDDECGPVDSMRCLRQQSIGRKRYFAAALSFSNVKRKSLQACDVWHWKQATKVILSFNFLSGTKYANSRDARRPYGTIDGRIQNALRIVLWKRDPVRAGANRHWRR
jgi:hypothetical protein